MTSILLAFGSDDYKTDAEIQESQKFYYELVTIAKHNRAVRLLGENVLLLSLNANGSLSILYDVLARADGLGKIPYKFALYAEEPVWFDQATSDSINSAMKATFG